MCLYSYDAIYIAYHMRTTKQATAAYHVRSLGEANAHPSFRFSLHVDIQPTVIPTISIYGNVHTTVVNVTIWWTLKVEPVLI